MKVTELKKSTISRFLATSLSFLLFAYFAYHLVHGERGYFALKGLEKKLEAAQEKYDERLAQRLAIENRVRLLRPGSIDLDMLDERTRVILGFVKPEERVVITQN